MLIHNLPYYAAPFVNRVSEIAEIKHRLHDSSCRLLTLVGPGGIGKTRLAVQAVRDCVDRFADGVYCVLLQPLDSPEFIVFAIADAVSFTFSPGGNPQQQLLRYLREKALLLLLDNFENLLDGAELLSEILAAAPAVKLLVTSREVLNLQEEWLYPVHGLHYPATNDVEQRGTYSAVQLFIERARQVSGNLALVDEHASVIRVCQLVDGMPLALELAAVWTKALSTDEIANEIQRNLDFLSTSLRNVPQRHQSMQAVFEQTWRRLTDEERRVFQALSVFSGGFRREAAHAVVGVSLRVLSNLVDKSLLTSSPNGRYQIHELLRQYAEARLETTHEESTRIRDLHSAYYAHILHERDNDLINSRQWDTALEMAGEIDNIRAAWSWAVEHGRVEDIDRSEHPLYMFYIIQNRYLEGANAFEKAARMLDTNDPQTEIFLANVLYNLGSLYSRIGVLEKAQAALERSWQLYSRQNALPAPGQGEDPRIGLGESFLRLGKYSEAEQLGQDALRDHALREDRYKVKDACYLLGMVARVQGQYEAARNYVRQGYAAATTGQELENMPEMGIMLFYLGRIDLDAGDYGEAGRCFEQVRLICIDLGHNFGVAQALIGIGNSACSMGHYSEARRCLREALQLTRDGMMLLPLIYVGIGDLFLQTGRQARGIELLTFALYHPASDYETKERVHRLLSPYPPAEAAQHSLTNVDFDALTNALLDELLIPEGKPLTRHAPYTDQPLVEPLSERELEVLTLIADDLSNREIADQLFLSVATVKWYLTHIYGKLGVQNRTLAIIRARQINLLP